MKPVFYSLFMFFMALGMGYAFEKSVPKDLHIDNSSKIYGATVPTTFELYAFAPDMLIGWNTALYDTEKKYIPEKYKKLPILGGWYGSGNFPNKETLLSRKIDAAFSLGSYKLFNNKIKEFMNDIKIPCVVLSPKSLKEYAVLYKELGVVLNREERGAELAKYVEKSLKTASDITKRVKKKKRVYVALQDNGLTTQCPADYDNDILAIAGGINVHKCISDKSVREQVNMEQILTYNPDMILVDKKEFFKTIKTDKKWRKIPAVQNGNVILVPREPFSWLEKQTVMRFLAVQYIAAKLYPEYSNLDLQKEARSYLKLFLDYDMTDEEANLFINPEKTVK